MHGDFNYKPKWSESNRNCELRYLDVPLVIAVNKQLKGSPGLSERAVDPFQDQYPCWTGIPVRTCALIAFQERATAFNANDCGGSFDGFTVTSDAGGGL